MKPLPLVLAAAVVSFAATANAQSGLTHAQAKAQLEEARRNGDLIVAGELGLKQNELRPDLYPKHTAVPGKTRQQVKEELAQAIRNGEIPVGDIGEFAYELRPELYPHRLVATKTRAEVRAQTLEAVRNGDIVTGENDRTLRELYPLVYAGHRTGKPAGIRFSKFSAHSPSDAAAH